MAFFYFTTKREVIMDYFFEDSLPCLQSVSPWWSETDRRILFCYLKAIFNLESDYLSDHQAAVYSDNGEERRLSSIEITNEYNGFKKEVSDKRLSCSRIKSCDFNYGKFNSRICYLCPYSRQYKNLKFFDERRILSFIINRNDCSIQSLKNSAGITIDRLFKSYFPVFYKGCLVDAFPLSIIAKEFESLSAGSFQDEQQRTKEDIINKVHTFFKESRTYNKKTSCINEHIPDYESVILDSIKLCFSYIEESTENNRSVHLPHIRRIFNTLNDDTKYIPKKPSQFNILENTFDDVDVHKYFELEELSLAESLTSSESTNINNSNKPITNVDKDIVPDESSSIKQPINILSEFEDDNFKSLEVLGLVSEHIDSKAEGITALPLQHISHNKQNREKKNVSKLQVVEKNNILDKFLDFYNIDEVENIFEYGTAENSNDAVIFSVFLEDNSFLSMEPAIFHSKKGILILNSREEKVFYCISDYGPKPIRNLSALKIDIFSSSCYHLYDYLFKNKVYKLQLHDVGMAYSLYTGKSVKGHRDLSDKTFPQIMNYYPLIYSSSTKELRDEQLKLIERLESFIPCVFSDGSKPPFMELNKLCVMKDSVSYDFIYNNEAPVIDGMFLGIKTSLKTSGTECVDLKTMYMDTCIDFNKRYPFHTGNINIIHMDSRALIFYLTGPISEIKKMQLYISASTHRCFSTALVDESNYIVEEKPLFTNKNISHLIS